MTRERRAGFTLIELLVVISIIAILMAILFPTINKALERARMNKAQSEATSIASAVQMFYNQYSRLPAADGDQGATDVKYDDADSESIIKALIGNDDILNPRKIRYLDAQNVTADGEFLDPWGEQYSIAMDLDYDEWVDISPFSQVPVIAVAFSRGPDRAEATDPEAEETDDIYSYNFDADS